MRTTCAALLLSTFLWTHALMAQIADFSVGSIHDIVNETELRAGPGVKYEKLINQKASDTLRRIEYLTVDQSTTVIVLDVKGQWAQIQVVEPAFFSSTHQGWVPISALKHGKPTHKRDGWVLHTCFVYSSRDTKSRRVGFLQQRAATNVVDDGSDWLELPFWNLELQPVMGLQTNALLDETLLKGPMFIQKAAFTETPPGQW